LEFFAQMPIRISADNFVPGMLQKMNHLFPQKTVYVGTQGLTALIHEGRVEARKHRITTLRGEGLIVVLMYAFGHACTNDPLYPWISGTLGDERIVDPDARAALLERKAVIWLQHVNARNEKRAQG
jgi:hypothetical protein